MKIALKGIFCNASQFVTYMYDNKEACPVSIHQKVYVTSVLYLLICAFHSNL